VGISSTSPGDQTYPLNSAALSYSFSFSSDVGVCTPTWTYDVTCYTDVSYTTTKTCPTFITQPTETSFSAVSSDIAYIGEHFYKV